MKKSLPLLLFGHNGELHIVKDVVVVKLFPSIRPVIHPWMASYREENPGRNK
jgi:hypothetical protein